MAIAIFGDDNYSKFVELERIERADGRFDHLLNFNKVL